MAAMALTSSFDTPTMKSYVALLPLKGVFNTGSPSRKQFALNAGIPSQLPDNYVAQHPPVLPPYNWDLLIWVAESTGWLKSTTQGLRVTGSCQPALGVLCCWPWHHLPSWIAWKRALTRAVAVCLTWEVSSTGDRALHKPAAATEAAEDPVLCYVAAASPLCLGGS